MRVGMLTGGGDCPGLNAVIRAAVRKGVLHHGDEFVGFMEGWRGVLDYLGDPAPGWDYSSFLPDQCEEDRGWAQSVCGGNREARFGRADRDGWG